MPRSPAALLVAALAVVATACTGAPTSAPTATEPADPTARPVDEAAPAPSPRPSPTPDDTTVVMWASGGLPAEVATRAAALPGVVAALHVRSDTVPLVGSRDARGRPVDDLDPGWRIPVEAVALDPGAADLLPPGPTRDAVAALRPGAVLLPAGSAAQRGLDVGGELDLGDRRGLVVAAVVDGDVVGRGEVLVHVDDADAVGLEQDGSLRVVHDGPVPDAFADRLESLVPEGTVARVVLPTADEAARRAPLVLRLPEVKARFGEFAYRDDDADREIQVDPAWVDEHVVVAEVPLLGRVRCHEAIVEDLRAALQAVADAGFGHTMDRSGYGGCYHPRRIGSGSSLSRHSWGIAIDINVDLSMEGYGPVPDDAVIDAFAAHGFRWGGHFLTADNHHWEWVGDAAAIPPPDRA